MKTIEQKLISLGQEVNHPCVTISLNTHRTHPDSEQDKILLKNLVKDAENRILELYGKREVKGLLDKLYAVEDTIDVNYNLDSLHIFLSNDTKEIIKSMWPVAHNSVQVDDRFAVRSLIKSSNRVEEYYIMVLSQSGVQLYDAVNDRIVEEIKEGEFPYPATPYFLPNAEKASDGKQVDNMIREYINKVDQAFVKIHNGTDLGCVVICTEENYRHLMEVANKPGIYLGNVSKDYNNASVHQLATQAWEFIKDLQFKRRTAAIEEVQAAISQGKVVTDLQEIYQASIDGRADLLVVNMNYTQPAMMTGDRTFDYIDDPATPEAVDDIVSSIAWETLSKNGRVVFTSQESLNNLGQIALKVRY
ncbi:baeRF3 domain-containing protein [Gynurincola endophyticus]|uniref:baeRF3 domain-containing protein n=1 Tax=Gynurincola endophyticus TaxID=2479004 RepID=UPI000F8D5774|nr:hypothetical protein [Gynurincola endophyticus]